MKTIKELVEESVATAKKLMAENPGISNIGFEFIDLSVEDMQAAAKEFDTTQPEFRGTLERFTSCLSPISGVFIHLRSVKVKAKLVYEPETV